MTNSRRTGVVLLGTLAVMLTVAGIVLAWRHFVLSRPTFYTELRLPEPGKLIRGESGRWLPGWELPAEVEMDFDSLQYFYFDEQRNALAVIAVSETLTHCKSPNTKPSRTAKENTLLAISSSHVETLTSLSPGEARKRYDALMNPAIMKLFLP